VLLFTTTEEAISVIWGRGNTFLSQKHEVSIRINWTRKCQNKGKL